MRRAALQHSWVWRGAPFNAISVANDRIDVSARPPNRRKAQRFACLSAWVRKETSLKPRLFVLAVLAAATLVCTAQAADSGGFDADMDALAAAWAHVNYEIQDPRAEVVEAEKFTARAADLAKRNPGRAEPLAWEALFILCDADARHDLRSLELVRTAKHLLERAAKIDPNALGAGVIYANLGSLYAQLPGFPLSFGDVAKAERLLEQAVAASPDGLDSNYFYGDFLYRQGDTARAIQTLQKALAAPSRPGRRLADNGRKWEAGQLLSKIHHKVKDLDGRAGAAASSGRRF